MTPDPLDQLVRLQLEVWPEHADFLARSMRDRDPGLLDLSRSIARKILALTGPNGHAHAAAYRWMCERFNEETLLFLRDGRYRNRSFAQAREEVYDEPEVMASYMRGLLMSQVFWINHAEVLRVYIQSFLQKTPAGSRVLELGPGHGLLTALVVEEVPGSRIQAWDISPSAIAEAARNLEILGVEDRVELRLQDALTAIQEDCGTFDRIVLSEILEHLEEPMELLTDLRKFLAPGGQIFVNAPANAPAPDHIYLLDTPEALATLVHSAGFQPRQTWAFPAAGQDLSRATRLKYPISCIVLAEMQP